MARLSEIGGALKQVGPFTFIKRVWGQLSEDQVFTWGAALAYSWMFAIFPFLIFLLSLVPLIPERFKPDPHSVDNAIDQILTGDAATALKGQVSGILNRETAARGFLSFGLILTIWAASGGMSMTMSALDKAYDVERSRSYLRQRSIAILLTIIVATLVVAVMVLLPIATGLLGWLIHKQKIAPWLYYAVNVARYAIALAMMFGILALIYEFGPSVRREFTWVTPGAVFCVTVWMLLLFSFRLYLTRFGGAENYNKTYGAVAGAVVLLLFFYIDALVLLIGAEINSELDFVMTGRRSPDQSAVPAAQSPIKQPGDAAVTHQNA